MISIVKVLKVVCRKNGETPGSGKFEVVIINSNHCFIAVSHIDFVVNNFTVAQVIQCLKCDPEKDPVRQSCHFVPIDHKKN